MTQTIDQEARIQALIKRADCLWGVQEALEVAADFEMGPDYRQYICQQLKPFVVEELAQANSRVETYKRQVGL